jgi:hypothetical protein
VIIRGIRVRDSQDPLIVQSGDGFQFFDGMHNFVLDHCSAFNSQDGNCDVSGFSGQPLRFSHDGTLCWNILGKGDLVKNSLIAYNVRNLTAHHNLYHGSLSRNPQVKEDDAGGAVPAGELTLDFVNNVRWGWKKGVGTYIQKGARVNYRRNYGYATNKGDDYQDLVTEPVDGHPLLADKRTHVYSNGNFNLEGFNVDAMGDDPTPQGTGVPSIGAEDDVSAGADLIRYVIAFAGPRFPTKANPSGLDLTDQRLIDEIVGELFRRMA